MAQNKGAGGRRGQVLVIVIVILLVVSTLVPLMVFYSQREAVWTAKGASNTAAFHMAEAGTEKGYLELSLSTQTWVNLQNGIIPAGYNFDQAYTDLSGGSYAISITSGPGTQEATIISVGRDSHRREVRAIKAIYANAALGNIAIMGGNGINVTGSNLTVEWGSIISPQAITPNGANHPSYWSSDNIVGLDTNGTTPPNCDSPNCWWWHSYYTGIPPMPTIDFNAYKSSAIASGNSPCGGKYYTCSTCTVPSTPCSDLSGKTYYVEGNWSSFDGPINGSVIVMGNFGTPNGVMHGNTINAAVPQQAWKQYCNDWSYYLTNYNTDSWLSANYPTYCPGLTSTYQSPAAMTKSISPVVQGLLYVGGNLSGPQGGGNTDLVYGVIYVKGTVTLNSNSHVKVYYSSTASQALQTTQIVLSRQSWQDVVMQWPSGL